MLHNLCPHRIWHSYDSGHFAVGMAAYWLKGFAPDSDLGKIYLGMLEFIILRWIGRAIVVFFPQVALGPSEVLIR